jgi:quercetin dioxygenase-like cupin family protein
MKLLRIYADAHGESHFDEADVPFSPANFAPPAPPVGVSERQAASSFLIVNVPAGWKGSWHPSPHRQVWIGISGTLRVTASAGDARDIPSGTPWLMEDTIGRGHATTAIGDEPAIGAMTLLLPKEGQGG